MKQQIIIAPDGSVSSMEMKRGKGLDIRQLGGQVDIVRSSVVEFIPELQKNVVILLNAQPLLQRCWNDIRDDTVHSRDTQRNGVLVTARVADLAGVDDDSYYEESCDNAYDGTVSFFDYEDAVAFEVKVIQGLREKFGPGIV